MLSLKLSITPSDRGFVQSKSVAYRNCACLRCFDVVVVKGM